MNQKGRRKQIRKKKETFKVNKEEANRGKKNTIRKTDKMQVRGRKKTKDDRISFAATR